MAEGTTSQKSQYIVTLHGRYTRALTFKNLCQGCATVGFPSTFSPLARELRRKKRLASRSEKYFLQWLHTVNILVRALTYKNLYQVTSRKFGAALAPSSWLIPTDSRWHFFFCICKSGPAFTDADKEKKFRWKSSSDTDLCETVCFGVQGLGFQV